MSSELQKIRVRPPLHELSEKDAAASSQGVLPKCLPSGEVDGEVGRARVSPAAGRRGCEGFGRHARAVGRQLRLGPVRSAGAVTAARVTGTRTHQTAAHCKKTKTKNSI